MLEVLLEPTAFNILLQALLGVAVVATLVSVIRHALLMYADALLTKNARSIDILPAEHNLYFVRVEDSYAVLPMGAHLHDYVVREAGFNASAFWRRIQQAALSEDIGYELRRICDETLRRAADLSFRNALKV